MCEEQCVPLRDAAERLEIRILVLEEQLFLVIMGLRTKHPVIPGLIPLYPGSGAAALKFLSTFLKSYSVLGL